MGTNIIYPSLSEKYKELIDTEVENLLNDAYKCAAVIIENSKNFIQETSDVLKRDKIIKVDKLNELIKTKSNFSLSTTSKTLSVISLADISGFKS